MGQLLEDEISKVDSLAERERVVKHAETELKVQRQEHETEKEKMLI